MLEKIKNNFKETDIIIKKIESIYLIYLETLVNGNIVNDICINKDIYINKNNLIKVKDYKEIENYLLNGFIIFYENNESIYTMEVRSTLDRGINTSESEISIRGPKDSFNENFNKNLGLIRNRIRSSHLKNKNINIGKLSNTKVSILYINNIAKLDKVNIIEEKLKSIDIDGIIDSSYLKKYFKNQTSFLINSANGIDYSKVEPRSSKSDSISVSETLPYDVSDKEKIKEILFRQTEEVTRSLRWQKQYAKTVAITYKNSSFQSYQHQMKLDVPDNSTTNIYKAVMTILDESWKDESIRNIGVRLADFCDSRVEQVSMFSEVKEEKIDKIEEIADSINKKYGGASVMPASIKVIGKMNRGNKKSLK